MFKDGKKHGEGVLFYSNGARYEGQWSNDKKQGEGVLVFENGTVFVGEFADDKPIIDAASKDLFMGYGPKTMLVRGGDGVGLPRQGLRRAKRPFECLPLLQACQVAVRPVFSVRHCRGTSGRLARAGRGVS